MLVWLALLLCAVSLGIAVSAENQAVLTLFAETSTMKMVGMPDLSEMLAGIDPSLLAKMPGMAQMPMFAPTRSLKVELESPGIAPENATAWLAVPPGLKLGPRLDLGIWRPQAPTQETEEATEPASSSPSEMPKFTLKYYWGSSPTVKPGQPEVMTQESLGAEQMEALAREMQEGLGEAMRAASGQSTLASWPTTEQPGQIAQDAQMPGAYALTTNYTGNAQFQVPDPLTFLAAIDLASPSLKESPPLDQPIVVAWNPIPGVLGYQATAVGLVGQDTVITWTSSEVKPQLGTEMHWTGFTPSEKVKSLVDSKVFMGPDRKEVTIPAGIFKGCDSLFFMMTGYGPGIVKGGNPEVRVHAQTTLNMVLLGGPFAMPESSNGQ